MLRIFTRNWFWLLVTTIVPVLWTVLTEQPADEAASRADSAAQLKAATALCQRLDHGACRGAH